MPHGGLDNCAACGFIKFNRGKRDISIPNSFSITDMNDHSFTVNVADFEMEPFSQSKPHTADRKQADSAPKVIHV